MDTKEPRSVMLTVEQVAELLGISRGSAYERVRDGTIPSLKLGRRIVCPPDVVERMMRRALNC